MTGAALSTVVAALESLAPPALAAEWDNVGLLLAPRRGGHVRRVLLTIDLTAAVAREARAWPAGLVVAYHPPVFAPLRRLDARVPLTRVLLELAGAGIAVWSPHTALDAAPDGLNDWLAAGLGPGAVAAAPGDPARTVTLRPAIALATLVARVKRCLRLRRVQVAAPAAAHRVRTVRVCAGAGGSAVLAQPADAYVTGELRHHDVLACVAQGAAVVVAGHSESERAYLPVFARRLQRLLGAVVAVQVARADRAPLVIR